MPERSVTIVMRTRDRPVFLERALGSVLAQTFRDFEVIVANDGGDPATVERVVEAHGPDDRLRVLHITQSEGMGAASNEAIRAGKSTYIAIHDDDDTWAPSFLEQMTARLEETGAMGVLATTDKVVEQVEGDRITLIEQTRLNPDLQSVNLYRMCLENYAAPICFLYRRSAYEKIGGYRPEFDSAGDWEFALRFLTHFDIDVLRTPEALAFYHHRPAAEGGELNYVYTDRHRFAENLVANTLLREDLAAGKFGLGAIVNLVKHGREREDAVLRHLQEASSVQVDYLADSIWKVDRRLVGLEHAVTPGQRLKADLTFARSLPARVVRRLRPR